MDECNLLFSGKKHKAEFQHLIDQVTKRKKTASEIKAEEKGLEQEEAEDVPRETGMECWLRSV